MIMHPLDGLSGLALMWTDINTSASDAYAISALSCGSTFTSSSLVIKTVTFSYFRSSLRSASAMMRLRSFSIISAPPCSYMAPSSSPPCPGSIQMTRGLSPVRNDPAESFTPDKAKIVTANARNDNNILPDLFFFIDNPINQVSPIWSPQVSLKPFHGSQLSDDNQSLCRLPQADP